MVFSIEASLTFWTSAEPRSFTFIDLPIEVSPLPSAPWHMAHLALKMAPPSAANDCIGATMMARMATARIRRVAFMMLHPLDVLSGVWQTHGGSPHDGPHRRSVMERTFREGGYSRSE